MRRISYADNWRLWLNACNWAGQLQINTSPLTIDKIATLQADKQALLASRDDSKPVHFDELVGIEPDRNASPTLLSGSWQVECWEDLSGGNFHWVVVTASSILFLVLAEQVVLGKRTRGPIQSCSLRPQYAAHY